MQDTQETPRKGPSNFDRRLMKAAMILAAFVALMLVVALATRMQTPPTACGADSCEVADDDLIRNNILWHSGTAYQAAFDHQLTENSWFYITADFGNGGKFVSATGTQTLYNKTLDGGSTTITSGANIDGPDIDGGSIDNATLGGVTPASATFTTATTTGTATLNDATIGGGYGSSGMTIAATGALSTDSTGTFDGGLETTGLTVDQAAADDEAVKVVSSDVAHGMTTYWATDTYGTLQKYSDVAGGLQVVGLRDNDSDGRRALFLAGYLADTPETTGAGIVDVRAAVSDGGTGVTYATSSGILASISNLDATQWNIDGSGNVAQNGWLELSEVSAPAAGAANTARLYAKEDGGGLTDVCFKYQDGSEDCFSGESTVESDPIVRYGDQTKLDVVLLKPTPGQIVIAVKFPDGSHWPIAQRNLYDPAILAASADAAGPVPVDWGAKGPERIQPANPRLVTPPEGVE